MEFVKKNIAYIIFTMLVISILFNIKSCNKRKQDSVINNQNIQALTSQLNITKNKLGEIEFSRASLSLSKEQLEKVNKTLYDEISKSKYQIIVIQEENLEYRRKLSQYEGMMSGGGSSINQKTIDSLYSHLLDRNKEAFKISWNSNTLDTTMKFDLKGNSIFNMSLDSSKKLIISNVYSFLDEYSFSIKLFTGIRKNDKGIYEAYARSDNPNIHINVNSNIEPELFFEQKKKNWSVGLHFGYSVGLNSPAQPNASFMAGFGIGIGINYNIWDF